MSLGEPLEQRQRQRRWRGLAAAVAAVVPCQEAYELRLYWNNFFWL
jgi:hypothetical protein